MSMSISEQTQNIINDGKTFLWTSAEISQKYGISRQRVHQILEKAGLPRYAVFQRVFRVYYILKNPYMSSVEIAKHLRITPYTVNKIRRNLEQSRPRLSLRHDFEKNVRKHPYKCWRWIGKIERRSGYGVLCRPDLPGRKQHAHRVSWMLEHGEIPDGMHILHKCDNTKCVRPSHLYLGDMTQNMKDKVERNRGFKKLTDYHKRVIKRAKLAGIRVEVLATRYDVSIGTIYKYWSS